MRLPCPVPVTAAFILFSNLVARQLTFLFNVLFLRESEGQKNVSSVPGKTGKRRGRPPKRKKLQEDTFMRWENLSVWRSLTQTLMLEGLAPCLLFVSRGGCGCALESLGFPARPLSGYQLSGSPPPGQWGLWQWKAPAHRKCPSDPFAPDFCTGGGVS